MYFVEEIIHSALYTISDIKKQFWVNWGETKRGYLASTKASFENEVMFVARQESCPSTIQLSDFLLSQKNSNLTSHRAAHI